MRNKIVLSLVLLATICVLLLIDKKSAKVSDSEILKSTEDDIGLRFELLPETAVCPICKKNKGIRILFGLPTKEAMNESDQDKFYLGGCVVMKEHADYHCTVCDSEWRADETSFLTR